MNQSLKSKHGFTLIELLTVIAIIAILAALLFPAIKKALQKAENAKAQTEVHAIETAWKAYFNEYGQWPVDTSSQCLGQPAAEATATGILTKNDVTALLLGSTTAVGNYNPADPLQNPKHIQFLNLKMDPASGQFMDPWGRPYHFLFDSDYDNQIINPTLVPASPNSIPRTVIVWSGGPTGANDIKSW